MLFLHAGRLLSSKSPFFTWLLIDQKNRSRGVESTPSMHMKFHLGRILGRTQLGLPLAYLWEVVAFFSRVMFQALLAW